MTVETIDNRVIHTTIDNQLTYAFTFKTYEANTILVYLNGNQVDSSDYTVALNADQTSNPGGTVTLANNPGGNSTLTIQRLVPTNQIVSLNPFDPFPSKTIENVGFDRLVFMVQQLSDAVSRSLRAGIDTPPGTNYALPPYNAGKALMWSETAQELINSTDNFNNIVSEAQVYAQDAENSANNSRNSADLAQEWSSKGFNEEITGNPGFFSAFHWATVAANNAAYDIAIYEGANLSPSAVIGASAIPRDARINTSDPIYRQSRAYAFTPPTANVTLSIRKIQFSDGADTEIGQAAFNANQEVGTVTWTSAITNFVAGDLVYVRTPAAVAGMGVVTITLALQVGPGTSLRAENVPVGAIAVFATEIAPQDWLPCDGRAVSRTTYANLFNAIGVRYGSGDGTTTFNIPDLRGQFLRGWDNGAGNDPDAANRGDRGDGTTGDAVGTTQDDAISQHTHLMFSGTANNNIGISSVTKIGGGSATGSNNDYSMRRADNQTPEPSNGPTSASGGNESRPKNVNVLYCIRAL